MNGYSYANNNPVNDAVGEPRKLLNSSSNSRFMSRKTLRFVVVRQQHRESR
jgi:hypothetical protein